MPGDFTGEILQRHASGMIVLTDTPTEYSLATPAQVSVGKPLWFGAVMLKKSAVTYHLMPLYFNPKLQSAVPESLQRRKQGKTCFNFQRPDAELFTQLDKLTRLARDGFERHGLLQPGDATARIDAAMRSAGTDIAALAQVHRDKGKAATAKRSKTIKAKNK
jgi:hypothetical protein